MHEIAEHIEHAKGGHGHGESHGHGGGPGKAIGITMAMLGVMLAFCAAMVGAARTELIATMVEQSNKFSGYQAESMKFRVMEADVEMLHALTPTKSEVEKFETKLRDVKRVSGKADDEDTQELKTAIALAATELADVLTPDPEDENNLKNLAQRYEHDAKEAREDAECYDDKIEAHFYAAEWYERAQLAAEIGIVIASVALLLSSRAVWYVALVFAIGGAGIITRTYVHTGGMVEAAEKKIEEAQKREAFIDNDMDNDGKPDVPPAGSGAPADKPEAKPAEPKKE
ncbi:MAG TPA: DUF4337 family protein [Polyangiaceae bacterium]|nr:DUF4337 family protein [Polyangiaceae bacterium]